MISPLLSLPFLGPLFPSPVPGSLPSLFPSSQPILGLSAGRWARPFHFLSLTPVLSTSLFLLSVTDDAVAAAAPAVAPPPTPPPRPRPPPPAPDVLAPARDIPLPPPPLPKKGQSLCELGRSLVKWACLRCLNASCLGCVCGGCVCVKGHMAIGVTQDCPSLN